MKRTAITATARLTLRRQALRSLTASQLGEVAGGSQAAATGCNPRRSDHAAHCEGSAGVCTGDAVITN